MASDYMERMLEEADQEFIRRAAKAIENGESWSGFLEKNREYTISGEIESKRCRDYVQMRDRRDHSKKGTGSVETELQRNRNEWFTKRRDAANERIYQDCREELMGLASEHCGWPEAKRRSGLTSDFEPFYRRAQAEAGISKATEREDPQDAAFALGFFG